MNRLGLQWDSSFVQTVSMKEGIQKLLTYIDRLLVFFDHPLTLRRQLLPCGHKHLPDHPPTPMEYKVFLIL